METQSKSAEGARAEAVRLAELARRAQEGDESALLELRDALEANPAAWEQRGDLAVLAREYWLQMIAGEDLLMRETVRVKTAALRAEVAGAGKPSPLQQLLIDRVVASWLQLSYCDAAAAQAIGSSPKLDLAAQKRQSAAQARYLAAVKQLVLIRRLELPVQSPAGGRYGAEAPPLRVVGGGS